MLCCSRLFRVFLPLQQPKFDCVANVTKLLRLFFYYFLLDRILNYRIMTVSRDPKEIYRNAPFSSFHCLQLGPRKRIHVFGGIRRRQRPKPALSYGSITSKAAKVTSGSKKTSDLI